MGFGNPNDASLGMFGIDAALVVNRLFSVLTPTPWTDIDSLVGARV